MVMVMVSDDDGAYSSMCVMMMTDDFTNARVQSNTDVNSVCAMCEQAWLVACM